MTRDGAWRIAAYIAKLPDRPAVCGSLKDFWVLRFRLMVKRVTVVRAPQVSEGEAQHGLILPVGGLR